MKRRLSVVSGALVAALALAACGGGDTTTPADDETTADETSDADGGDDTLTFVIGGDPMSLNPINVSDRWGLTTTNIVYSPLARIEPDGTIRNELAETIEPAEDGLSVTVTLREDARWSDGEPVTADDVVFSYTQKANPENGNADQLIINGEPITATAVDEHTVRFDLPEVNAAAINNLAFENYIIPEHVYGEVTDFSSSELDPAAVGSGPYKLIEYRPGEYITLEANENFYGEAPQIQNITLRIVTNADTVKAALQTGEIDASAVLPADIADLEAAPVNTYAYSEGRVAYLGVISTKPALADATVRQALFFGINRDELNTAAYLSPEYYENAQSILPPSNPFATTDVESYDHDSEEASRLLAEAGAEGLTVTLAYSSSDPAQTVQATLIQQQLGQIGVDVQLSGLDGAALYADLENGADASFDLFLGGYIMGNDPDAYSALFRTDASYNYFDYSNPATDALFDQGAAELDEGARAEIYADLQRQIADDAVFYPIVDNRRVLAVNERVSGVEEAGLVPIYSLENWNLLTIGD